MTTYVIKRLLLMVPTLIGISTVIWVLMVSSPGEPGGQSQDQGGQSKKGRGGGGESRRIYRAQFNLDKPLFWNDYVDLTALQVFDTVVANLDREQSFQKRNESFDKLEDWGYFAVPHLVGALELTTDPVVKLALMQRLQRNGKRIAPAALGKALTEEDRATNREVLRENLEIKQLAVSAAPTPSEIAEKEKAWKAWIGERKDRWEWTDGERLKIQLLDTKFARYWANLARFDLGYSHIHRKPVVELLGERIRVSLALAVSSLILAYLLSVPLGVWSAVRHRTRREQMVSTALFMLYSLPSFFAATLILKYFGVEWGWIPVHGFESEDTFSMTTWDHWKDIGRHVVAPIFCMTYASLAALSRYAKSGLLNVIRSDYIRTARAKGLSEFVVVMKHAVRNGMMPIITLLGATLPVVIGGSVIIESVFKIPGMGFLMIESIFGRDYNVVVGVSMISAILTMFGILLADIAYAVVDPRISYK